MIRRSAAPDVPSDYDRSWRPGKQAAVSFVNYDVDTRAAN